MEVLGKYKIVPTCILLLSVVSGMKMLHKLIRTTPVPGNTDFYTVFGIKIKNEKLRECLVSKSRINKIPVVRLFAFLSF